MDKFVEVLQRSFGLIAGTYNRDETNVLGF